MSAAEENAYELLGLPQGPAATEAEIKKAYRRLALAKHPDKNPDNPRAADEFAALQRAYDLLCDGEARAALDALLKARAARFERTQIHDAKRRRMAEDLARREAAAEGRSEEGEARARLAAEIERMRAAAAAREAARRAAAAAAAAPRRPPSAPPSPGPPAAAAGVAEALPRTLKVSWARPGLEYDAGALRRIFSVHGAVEDVVLREGKKRKGSALVVMASREGAAAAAAAVNGELSDPLLVVPLEKGPAAQESGRPGAAGTNGRATPSAGAGWRAGAAEPAVPAAAAAAAPEEPRPARPLGQKPSKPLFPAGAHASAARAAAARFSSFSSFQAAPGPAAEAGGGGGDDPVAARRRQEEQRRRMIAALQDEEDGDE